jgi:hypothetical protein
VNKRYSLFILDESVELHDVRVVERGDDLELLVDHLPAVYLPDLPLVYHLHCDSLFRLQVDGAVDLGEGALADHFCELDFLVDVRP